MKGRITKLSVAGAACYAIWGCLRIYGRYNVFMLGDSTDPARCGGAFRRLVLFRFRCSDASANCFIE